LPLGYVAELPQRAPDRFRRGAITGNHPTKLLALVPLADKVDPVLRLFGAYRVGKEKVDERVGVFRPVGLGVLHAIRAHLLCRHGGQVFPGRDASVRQDVQKRAAHLRQELGIARDAAKETIALDRAESGRPLALAHTQPRSLQASATLLTDTR